MMACIYSSILLVGCMLASEIPAHALDSQQSAFCEDTVSGIATSVLSYSDRDERIDSSLELASFIKGNTYCGFDAAVIDQIISLLDDPVDGVRMSAAMALADIGPSAMRAVPALKRAIQRSDAILDKSPSLLLPVNSSGEAARDALRKITGQPVPNYPAPIK